MRILIVDDEPGMHDSYRRSFSPAPLEAVALSAMAAELFDDALVEAAVPDYALTHCMQGVDAVAAVERAQRDGEPFAVAFIDVRMPPGIDGKETARRIRALDPEINLVIVTGFSDFSPLEISRAAGPPDKLFYIAKPFEVAEVAQTAAALTHRWRSDRELAAAREQLAAQVAQLEEQSVELAANESRAIHLATHDVLTEAPNRLAFQRALAERTRRAGGFAVAMLDLHGFTLVNDTLGHQAGDELLRAALGLIQANRPEGALVARLGSDEFGLLFDTPGEDAAVMAGERVVHACAGILSVFGHSVAAGASLGLVVTAGAARDAVDLMRRADVALNDAKRAGVGAVRIYDEAMDEGIRFRRDVQSGLSEAIARGELALVYQPIVARDALQVVGFEALMRWNTGEYGPIGPATFIPIAEQSDLIHDLGGWALGEALRVLGEWPGQYVSVNFSPRQFRRPNFIGHIVEMVQRAGVDPTRLQIEITETAIFDDAERAAETLYRLRQMGFRIALDDFGTGYSSLYTIRKFALDALKIDRSFVDGMARERESAAIVRSIAGLGHSLGLGVIAEGVETDAQLALLRAAGATHLQGYLFSRPVSEDQARIIAEYGLAGQEQPPRRAIG